MCKSYVCHVYFSNITNHTLKDNALTIIAPIKPHKVAKICVKNVKPTHISVTFKLLLALRDEVAATTPMNTTGTMSISSARMKSVPGNTNQSMSSLSNEEFLMPIPMPKPTIIDNSMRSKSLLSLIVLSKKFKILLGRLTVTKEFILTDTVLMKINCKYFFLNLKYREH